MTGELSSGQMTHSQEEFGIHLSQAINYLHSRHRHIKTWAAFFIGGHQGPGSESLFYPAHSHRGGKEGLGLSSRHTTVMFFPPSCSGYTTCNQPQAVSQIISDKDIKLLFSSKWPTPWICLHTPSFLQHARLRRWHRAPHPTKALQAGQWMERALLASYPDGTGVGSGGSLPSQGHL